MELESENNTLFPQILLRLRTIDFRAADGTDVNACDATDSLVAAGDDFGRVRAYAYPATQPRSGSVELHGHSAHVTDVAFLGGGARSDILAYCFCLRRSPDHGTVRVVVIWVTI